ncbi:MAG: type II toxin-antitoxin system VapC family toxin [Parachlamydiaceae bacterium]|nr:type II toxin-antitoxin system VapC family toxin [Parachlamydiaceae bacterium]
MIGLDTNVLVRYLVQDDPIQSKLANKLIEKTVDSAEILWICQLTLCETVWVLKKCYKLSKEEILHILHALLLVPQIKVENENVIYLALRDFERTKKVDFTDCLIGRQNAHNGCESTYTLDEAAADQLSEIYKPLLN